MFIQNPVGLDTNGHVVCDSTGRILTSNVQRSQNQRRISCVICGLSITEIVLGALILLLGVAAIPGTSLRYWVSQTGSGVWFSIWIIITGIVGVVSTRQSDNRCLGKTNMAFNIVCSVFSFLILISYAIGIWFFTNCQRHEWIISTYVINGNTFRNGHFVGNRGCKNKNVGVVLYSILFVFMVTEFCISLAISIHCCQSMGFCKDTCCDNSTEMYEQPVNRYNQLQQPVLITNTSFPQACLGLSNNRENTFYQPSMLTNQMVISQPGANLQAVHTTQPYIQ